MAGSHSLAATVLTESLIALPFLQVECLGGGRMNYEENSRKLLVYGFSQAYGRANHAVTASIVNKSYPLLTITTSNEGY